jgi:hypothetical protein
VFLDSYVSGICGTVALSHRALSAPQVFRHEAQDRREGRHRSVDGASNKVTFVRIL